MCSYMYTSVFSLFCLYLMPAIQFNFDYSSCAYSFISKMSPFPNEANSFSPATSSNAASPSFCLAPRTFQRTNFLTGCLHFNSSTSPTFSCVIGTTNTNAGSSLVCLFQQEQPRNVYISFSKTFLR